MGILSKVTNGAHGALDQVAGAAAPAAQWLEKHGETMKTAGDKLVEATGKYIAAHPLQSVGLALAAGYLISRFTR